MTEHAPAPRKRCGRNNPPVTRGAADAFSLDPMMTSRDTFGFLDGDRLDFMKNRVLSLLEDNGVMIVHPTAKAALLRAGARKGSEAGR